jgi:hypothetical protein
MDGYELSGIQNAIGVEYGAEMKDDTVFGTAGTRSNKPGLKTVKITGGGFWSTDYDLALYSRIGASRAVVTAAPDGHAIGDRCFFTRGVNGAYNPLSGEVGELLGFEIDFNAANTLLVRGAVAGVGAKSVTGTGTGVQLGGVIIGKRIYAALHVKGPITGTLPTLAVTIESDDNNSFTTPTTRLTFTGMTTVIGGQWQQSSGLAAITDDWWRAKWTIGGTLPSYPLFVSFGIF